MDGSLRVKSRTMTCVSIYLVEAVNGSYLLRSTKESNSASRENASVGCILAFYWNALPPLCRRLCPNRTSTNYLVHFIQPDINVRMFRRHKVMVHTWVCVTDV